MNQKRIFAGIVGFLAYASLHGLSQNFQSGSTGADGPLNVTSNMFIQLPPDGVLNYTTVTVSTGATVRFIPNAMNTPVYMLSTGDVVINGIIDVSGSPPFAQYVGGVGGPGGFSGGSPAYSLSGGTVQAGWGLGPGGGHPSLGAGYGAPGFGSSPTSGGRVYGTQFLIPMVGGSGGGGGQVAANQGGGGGGGALLIASTTKILVNSSALLRANGGSPGGLSSSGVGSGGAVRLVSPRVFGGGTIDVFAGVYSNVPDSTNTSGAGRIRVDSIFRSEPADPFQNLGLVFRPSIAAFTVGSTMVIFPTNAPRLDVINVAGTNIAVGVSAPIQLQLPFGSSTNQSVTVQAQNFNGEVPIRVVLSPQSGPILSFDATITNTTQNPAAVTVPVTVPINQLVTVNAWTR